MSKCTKKNCPLVGVKEDCDAKSCEWRTEEVMSDYIKREDAIATVHRMSGRCGSDIDFYHHLLVECFRVLPSADVVERKRGEWKIEETENVWGKGYLLTCSVCGDTFRVTENALPYEKYCRNCGADMREREGE